ncbi:hypothetical protein [Cyanobium sp. ATX 6F1]|uniref:hypothetical protein n=1 Tax=unclassified Cyanobium TaxID=2627006 RepID=UPI0020CD5B77|nr:hypothetical protein [Cyanobium sp. ATX 6F1]MCP9915245.1 hypothetical protein [Cyanobium sp. ATX 6F1]
MLRNAFSNLVSEGLALRLNQVASVLADLSMTFDTAGAKLRVSLTGETLPTVTTVGTVSAVTTVATVTTCSTVTTVGAVTNLASIGGVNAAGMVLESMETSWSTSIRGRIT